MKRSYRIYRRIRIKFFFYFQVEGTNLVVEGGNEMVVDVTEVVDAQGAHQQIYFHQPITGIQGTPDTQQTYTVVQKHLENTQQINPSQIPTTIRNVQNISGFEVMY